MTEQYPQGIWDASEYFEHLTATNRLAKSERFTFCQVSGLDGFEEALAHMQRTTAFVCVSDIANGFTELNNTPHTRRVKTVFLAKRHKIDDMAARTRCMETLRIDDMAARTRCMETLRELFRQYMSLLILEKTKLEQHCIYLDPRISFNEIDRYFFSGCACAYFQIAVDVYTDLRYNEDEWTDAHS